MGGVLVVIGGLPGVGKTTVARQLARRLGAAHVRVDAFEAALVRTGLVADQGDIRGEGYELALAAAGTCLAAGTAVVADAVFPIALTRVAWTALARRYDVPLVWVRLVCGDPAEHRRRVEQRAADLPGHRVPSWAQVLARETDAWTEPHAVVDTASGDPVAAVAALVYPSTAG